MLTIFYRSYMYIAGHPVQCQNVFVKFFGIIKKKYSIEIPLTFIIKEQITKKGVVRQFHLSEFYIEFQPFNFYIPLCALYLETFHFLYVHLVQYEDETKNKCYYLNHSTPYFEYRGFLFQWECFLKSFQIHWVFSKSLLFQ